MMSVNLSLVYISLARTQFLETLALLETGITKQIHLLKEFSDKDFKFEAQLQLHYHFQLRIIISKS